MLKLSPAARSVVARITWVDRQAKNIETTAVKHSYSAGASPFTDILPVIDDQGRVCGRANRAEVHRSGLLHPTVHLLIFSTSGELLVQKRGDNKDSSPGLLSQSVGGHMAFGSTVEATVKKEAEEELGIGFLPPVTYLTEYLYSSNNGRNQERVSLLTTIYKGTIRANPTELAWAAWLDFHGIQDLASTRPKRFAPSFLKDLEHYQRWAGKL